ncbi:MAG TPA: carbohydrate kinase family protein [bacterium]|mgnify:CR=1 FL=1|nr:carbohydrate kinase family protein [bacterium]
MTATNGKLDSILVVGSSTGENTLIISGAFEVGRKHLVSRHNLLGGSGLNYAFRLLNTGHSVIPVLTAGNDATGRHIQGSISKLIRDEVKNYRKFKHINFVNEKGFLCDGLNTPQTSIVVSHDTRSIFTEKLIGANRYRNYVRSRLNRIKSLENVNIKGVVIGHIYTDSESLSANSPGKITKSVIDLCHKKAITYLNFGESQISLGVNFWRDYLKKATVFQLSLSEVRRFFAKDNGGKKVSLIKMIKWFQENKITAIITLDKYGAIGTYKDGRRGLILCWPIEPLDIVDTTGAGDAFGSGVIANLYNKSNEIEFIDFYNAMAKARIWAAYACTTIGGANDCPNNHQLAEFESELIDNEKRSQVDPVEVQKINNCEKILNIFDKAY